ncbi:MAG: type II toxin-antitoxin system RelE/ParE family toxin [Solirubrobacteraceae bacterium]
MDEFDRWSRSLGPERRVKLTAMINRIVAGGPTLGRPHVDVIHGSRLRKLKEARVDRGIRVLFAFDSNQNAVMLLGGDKTGKWNRWYPQNIARAERLYADHERSIGKEPRCLSQREARRTAPQRAR